mgnify:CR=1 FL=1
MALSFGLGLSTSIRDARDRQQKKRLENKKVFDQWLKDKRERGESVKAEDLENEKFAITGGDSLYGDWIGNKAAMESMTTRHNEKVTSDILAETTQNIQNKSDQEKLIYDKIGIRDNYESFIKTVSNFIDPTGKDQAGIDLKLAQWNLTGDDGKANFENLQDQKWTEEIKTQMESALWSRLETVEQVKTHYGNYPPRYVAKIVDAWESEQKQIMDEEVSKATERIISFLQQQKPDALTSMGDEQIETLVRGYLESQPGINAEDVTKEMINKGIDQFNAHKTIAKTTMTDDIKKRVIDAFMAHPTMTSLISDGIKFEDPSMETISTVLKQALSSAEVPQWAIDEYFNGGDTLGKEAGKFADWVYELLGDNFHSELSKKLYQNAFENKYKQGEELAPEAIDSQLKTNNGLILGATKMKQWGETFVDNDGDEVDGMVILQQILAQHYVPSTQSDRLLSAIHTALTEHKGDVVNAGMIASGIASEMNLMGLSDWKAEITKQYKGFGNKYLKPNTNLELHTEGSVKQIEKMISLTIKQLEKLPTSSKVGETWLEGKGYYQMRDTLIQDLEIMRGLIQNQYTGEQKYAFNSTNIKMNVINTEHGVDFNGDGEDLDGIDEIGKALLKYIDDTIDDLRDDNGVLGNVEPTAVDAHTKQSTHKAFKVPDAKVIANANKFSDLKMNGGNEPLIIFESETSKLNLEIGESQYTHQVGGLNPKWTNGNTPTPNEEFKKLYLPTVIEIITEMDKFTPYGDGGTTKTAYIKALKNLILFNLSDSESSQNDYYGQESTKDKIRLSKEDQKFLKSNNIGFRYNINSPDIFSKAGSADLVGSKATGQRLDKFIEQLVLLAITEIKHGKE